MRARSIKPAFFKNEELAKLGFSHAMLFAGLWCLADREGRLEDRPERIRAEIFPFIFQRVKVNQMLDDLALSPERFITRYSKGSERFIQVNNFRSHQYPHIREQKSTIPAPCKSDVGTSRARLTAVNGVTDSPFLTPGKETPSAPKRLGAAQPFWQEVIKHINDTWSRKKNGAKYLWSGKDFAALKRALQVYQPWELMSLWDTYLRSEDAWVRDHGFDVPTFIARIPKLVDDYTWKTHSKKYEDQLIPPNPEGIAQVSSLVGSLAASKEFPQ